MSSGACTGCSFKEFGPVIFASGEFGADFTNNSLLVMYRSDLLRLPTTKCERCSGAIGVACFFRGSNTAKVLTKEKKVHGHHGL